MKSILLKLILLPMALLSILSCSKNSDKEFELLIHADKSEVSKGEEVKFFTTLNGKDVTESSMFCTTGSNGSCFAGNSMTWHTSGTYEIIGHYNDGQKDTPPGGYETSNTVKIIVL